MKKLMARVRAELARLWKFSGESRRPSLDQGGGTGDGDTLQGEEYEWQNYDLLIQPETDWVPAMCLIGLKIHKDK